MPFLLSPFRARSRRSSDTPAGQSVLIPRSRPLSKQGRAQANDNLETLLAQRKAQHLLDKENKIDIHQIRNGIHSQVDTVIIAARKEGVPESEIIKWEKASREKLNSLGEQDTRLMGRHLAKVLKEWLPVDRPDNSHGHAALIPRLAVDQLFPHSLIIQLVDDSIAKLEKQFLHSCIRGREHDIMIIHWKRELKNTITEFLSSSQKSGKAVEAVQCELMTLETLAKAHPLLDDSDKVVALFDLSQVQKRLEQHEAGTD